MLGEELGGDVALGPLVDVGEDGQLDLGPLEAAQLVLVVQAPHVHLGEITQG